MNKFYHQLNEEEKFIIENHFIHNKESSKQNFQKFCVDIITKYTGKPFDYKDQRNNEKDYSIELIWDKDNLETAMMHCFSHPKFKVSNGKMKSFAIFNGDVNFVNKDKQNALMILAQSNIQNKYSAIKSLLYKENGFDFTLLDKNNNTIHIHILNSYNKDTFADVNFENDRYFSFLGKLELFKDVLKDWMSSDFKKGRKQKDLVIEKSFDVAEGLKVMLSNTKDSIKDRFGRLEEMIVPEIKEIEATALMLKLKDNLQVNEVVSKVKRKI